MPTTIRRATLDDAAETAAVFTAAFQSMTFVPKLHSAEEDKAFVRALIADKETWVAVRNDHVVGLACLDGGWLEQLYVHPSRHNSGTGSKLFEHATRQHPNGFQFWTFQANAGARRFYERHGCALVRLTDGADNEEKTPDALYVWPAK
ncbi:MAG TPA: GNAT family N-acetyltransferase [Rhizomicrobium sp.]|jgi:GNAT superfamily N-acetyltransferase|nr:GNAT family N-acetyltransferase [Rhizomicrobium sp.]